MLSQGALEEKQKLCYPHPKPLCETPVSLSFQEQQESALRELQRLEARTETQSALPEAPLEASAITIGNFDGVHLAHKALLKTLIDESMKRGVPSVAFTFDPHPAHFLRPEKNTALLMPIHERIRKLKAFGIDHVVTLQFNDELATMCAESFVELVLKSLQPQLFVIGPDTRFGKNRSGNSELLSKMGKEAGFDVLPMPTLSLKGTKISSSGIRRCLQSGDVTTPRAWCESPFEIGGTVVPGAGRGRELGFRTANVESNWPTRPSQGVYVVGCLFPDSGSFYGVANLGTRPTFEDSKMASETLEVHLLDAGAPDLYGKKVQVQFLQRLRGEKQFESKESLIEQINIDISHARKVLEKEKR